MDAQQSPDATAASSGSARSDSTISDLTDPDLNKATGKARLSLFGRRRRTLTFTRFAVEIALVVLIKMAVLYGLWLLFFSQPLARHMHVPSRQMDTHFMSGASSAAPDSPVASSSFSDIPSHLHTTR